MHPQSNQSLPPHRLPFRVDIEGLRGWLAAVIVVYHLIGVPIGGIVGVDVFFVISGFLITGLLLRELGTTGRISISAFYARRARRILPVALVALAVTVALSPLVWFTPRAVRVGLDGFAALTFVENWHLIASQRSYLQHDAGVSPLQHYWSLAVEEQFYVVWPLLVIGAALLAGRLARPGRTTAILVAVACVGFVASAVYSAQQTSSDIDAAYFDTFGRAWEFVPGILAAVAANRLARLPRGLRVAAVWLGMASVAVACGLIDPHLAFPWPRALFAVLGTALVVGFGTGDEGVASRILGLAPARWLGKRSYSLYLWHFPAAIMMPAVLGRSWWALGLTLVVTILLAAASYRWIERPALRSGWLRSWETSPGDRRRDHVRRRVREVLGVATIALVVIGMGAAQLHWPNRLGDPTSIARGIGLAQVADPDPHQFTEAELGRAVEDGIRATRWPTGLRPSLDESFDNSLSTAFDPRSGCRNDPAKATPPQTCLFNAGGSRTAYLIGDSTAAAWAGGVARALGSEGWRLKVASYSGCSPLAVAAPVLSVNSPASPECRRSRGALVDLVREAKPDLVIVASGMNSFVELDAANGAREASRAWAAGAETTVRELLELAPRVVVLENPPAGESVVDCATRAGSPRDCLTDLAPEHRRMNAAIAAGVARATHDEAATFVPTRTWFCDARDRCPIVVGSLLVRPDRSHITDALTASLAGLLRTGILP